MPHSPVGAKKGIKKISSRRMKFVGHELCGAKLGNSYIFSVETPGKKRPLEGPRHR
jgi:hypothetical protein